MVLVAWVLSQILSMQHTASASCITEHLPVTEQRTEAEQPKSSGSKWTDEFPEKQIAKTLDSINSGQIPKAEGIKLLLSDAESRLKELGVEYERIASRDGRPALRIKPIRRGTVQLGAELNYLAAGLKKYDPRFELLYDPTQVSFSTSGTRAAVSYDKSGVVGPRLMLGHAGIMNGSTSEPITVHEMIHGKHLGDANRGIEHVYQVEITSNKPSSLSFKKRTGKIAPAIDDLQGHYDEAFKLDELVTYRYNLWEATNRYLKAVKSKSPEVAKLGEEVRQRTAQLMIVTVRAEDVSALAHKSISGFEVGKEMKWGSKTKFVTKDGEKFVANLKYGSVEGSEKRYAVFSIEEQPGILSGKKEIASFQIWIPLKDGYQQSAGAPVELIKRYIQQMADASSTLRKSLETVFSHFDELKDPYSLDTAKLAKLLTDLEVSTSRKESLPGYPDRRARP